MIAGVTSEPSAVTLFTAPWGVSMDGARAKDATTETRVLSFIYDAAHEVLTIRKPDVPVAQDFDVSLSFVRAS